MYFLLIFATLDCLKDKNEWNSDLSRQMFDTFSIYIYRPLNWSCTKIQEINVKIF